MAMVLAILSFVCAVVFALFLPVTRVNTSVPALAIVVWLGSYNLIHAINAVLWDGNVNIHIPVWCDIVTKIVLGVRVALPSALLCIASQLEHVSSNRKTSSDKRVVRNRTIFELVMCYFVPTLYMALHLVIQDRRFDLVSDYGCSASTHPSTLAFLMTWLPPLILCIITFILCSVSIHNSGRVVGVSLDTHLESRSSSLTASQFTRHLSRCMIMAGVLILVGLSSLFSLHSFESYTSWSAVHALMSKIEVLHSADEITGVQFAWWTVYVESLVYILLTLAIGEEARDVYRWIHGQAGKKREFPRFVLPLYHKTEKSSPEMISRSSSLTKPYLRPLTIELKSGWDDNLLDDKRSKRKGFSTKSHPLSPSPTKSHCSAISEDITEPPTATSPNDRSRQDLSPLFCASPTPSNMSITEDDQMFMASTISYLTSPTAKTLGIVAPLQIPAKARSPTPRGDRVLDIVAQRPLSPPSVSIPIAQPKSIVKAARSPPKTAIPVDVEEPLSSVLNESWPVPPESPVPSLSVSRHSPYPRSHSRSHSPASSSEDSEIINIGYPLRPTVTPPHRRTRPFEGSSISSTAEIVPNPSTTSSNAKRVPIKRPSIRSLNKSWSKERLGQAYMANEVIHMTVVRETV